jgi:ribosomal protein L12E/L44/L45/RPP1/RPP2
MNQLSVEDVQELGRAVGLEIDDVRASTIASRLSGIVAELEEIPEDLLTSVEPAHVFSTEED